MNIIIYGPDKPKIGFKQLPDGSISFQIENELTIEFDNAWQNITWRHLYPNTWAFQRMNEDQIIEAFKQFTSNIAELTGSDIEKKFFLDYANECLVDKSYLIGSQEIETVWDLPALIPQVWVNWIHYDPKDSKRAERAQKEPFRVDFMLKDADINNELVIIEIDGSSHFANMDAYTRHIQKDRWLRKQGWQVFRISNQEIEKYEDFNIFYYEVTGKYISIPF